MVTTTPQIEARAREMRDRLTLAEKIRMLSGDTDFYRDMVAMAREGYERKPFLAAGIPRLGLDGLRCIDGPRGISAGPCTCFPVAMARAATFDYDLEERVGEAIGREARARGANVVLAPCVNLLRHPAWGRAQETYGENSEHVGRMGAAFARGVQKHVMACVKHFACNSIENARFTVDVRVAQEVLDTVYLPHFERVVSEGVASVMSAYNRVNGEWCGENRHLLTTTLKERWGFDGFVVSDWVFGLRDGVKAVNAGLDLEMPSPLLLGKRLAAAVKQGLVPLERIDDAVLRLIRQQLRFADVGDGNYGPEVVASAEHRSLAREVATRAIVLLRNEIVDGRPVLPLGTFGAAVASAAAGAASGAAAQAGALPRLAGALRRLAVIGRLAAVPNTGDRGSSAVTPPYVVTPLEGLRAALEPLGVEVAYSDGADPARAAAVAAAAGAALVIAGYDYRDEGEYMPPSLPPGFRRLFPRPPFRLLPSLAAARLRMALGKTALSGGGDRESLELRVDDEELILAVAAANPRTVVAVMCGSAVLMERWRHAVPGILILWYPGLEGGHALADIILGRRSPTGRLPFAIPTSEEHLPFFDRNAESIEYGPLHGQALLDHLGVAAAYPDGFGLSYDG